MKQFKNKYFFITALTLVVLSGCSAKGVITDEGTRNYPASHPIYAELTETEDGGYRFSNFGFVPDDHKRKINLVDGSYDGLSDYEGCARGVLGLTSGNCNYKYQFARSYMTAGDAFASLFTVPIFSIPAIFIASDDLKVLPVVARSEFDYQAYNQAFMEAQSEVGFDQRIQKVLTRYDRLRSAYDELSSEALSLEDRLVEDFQNKVSVDVVTVNLSDAVPAQDLVKLSSSAVDWHKTFLFNDYYLSADPFQPETSLNTLDELSLFLDDVEATLKDRRRQLDSARITFTPGLHRSIEKAFQQYLSDVQLPNPVTWPQKDQVDDLRVKVVLSFLDADVIRNNQAEEAVEKANALNARLNRLRSSVGRQYCADGELTYSEQICFGRRCIYERTSEPGQLMAYLEGVSQDATRIKLRIANWDTRTGRLQGKAASPVTFTHSPNEFGFGSFFTQVADPGLVFWSDAYNWYPCASLN